MKTTAISMSMPFTMSCDHCPTEQEVDVWAIVSAVDRPDILQQVQAGLYPGFNCTQCDRWSSMDTPLLIHRPAQGGLAALIYSAAHVASPQDSWTMAEGLVAILFSNLGLNGENVEVPIFPVPRLALPAVLKRDIRQDIQTPHAQLDLPFEAATQYRAMINHLRDHNNT